MNELINLRQDYRKSNLRCVGCYAISLTIGAAALELITSPFLALYPGGISLFAIQRVQQKFPEMEFFIAPQHEFPCILSPHLSFVADFL
jgi:hypothetical protein